MFWCEQNLLTVVQERSVVISFVFPSAYRSVVTAEEINEVYFFFSPLFQWLLREGETGEQQEVFWSSFAGLLPKAKLSWCLSMWSLACHM